MIVGRQDLIAYATVQPDQKHSLLTGALTAKPTSRQATIQDGFDMGKVITQMTSPKKKSNRNEMSSNSTNTRGFHVQHLPCTHATTVYLT